MYINVKQKNKKQTQSFIMKLFGLEEKDECFHTATFGFANFKWLSVNKNVINVLEEVVSSEMHIMRSASL